MQNMGWQRRVGFLWVCAGIAGYFGAGDAVMLSLEAENCVVLRGQEEEEEEEEECPFKMMDCFVAPCKCC